ncbi:MAG TPA: LTA synthase family protein [Candidatus Blautia intestinigallinarum]|nr:LTA synthase family protein [Candidatus Blautia intestinigallinarum]
MKPWVERLNKISILIQALAVCVGYYLIETISRHSFGKAWTYMTTRPLVFLYNAGLIFTTTLIVYLVRRRVFVRTLLAIFWMTLGIINGVLLAQRVTPFTGPDLHLITDAFKIAKRYLPVPGMILAGIAFVLVIIGLVVLFLKGPRYQGPMKYKYNIPLVLAGVLIFAGTTKLALEKRVLSNYFGNIAFAYEDYGYPYCLATTIFNTGISCPQDYSQEEMDRILSTESDLEETQTDSRPNIIFLQLESFFDPTEVNFLEFSEDPIPNFRKLMEKYSSGYFKVPSVGAGTANTEFETITGMSLRYFGPGEYPYKSILKETTCESAPYVLKDLGYSTHAIHNNEANFYGRRTIFPNLGFDSFTSEEYMPEEDDKNALGWVKDEVLTNHILDCLQTTEGPDYVYTISVQGHGAYPDEELLEDPAIKVSGAESEEENNKWEYYVNQVHEMDQFVGQLIDALEENGEDTVLVMYGDHLPTMGLEVEDLNNRYLFQTEYVMWDNIGLEKEDEDVASYQMAAVVLDRLGIHEGNIFRYHQARRNTRNYQVDLETLQYDILYGEQYVYGGESPYKRTDMRMGMHDTEFTEVRADASVEGSYYIIGDYFTPSTEIQINGEWVDTNYLDTKTLLITGQNLTDYDRICVVQRSNSSTRKALTRTNNRLYYAVKSENPGILNFDSEDS